jgi:large subunit ribosomal protein L35
MNQLIHITEGGSKMPKMKSHRGAAKRFKVTKSGKVKRAKAFRSHILTKKSQKRKRKLRQNGYLEGADAANMKKILPY